MKLLIITQVIDTDHPILGFFHRWVAEFALHYEHVHVIALQVGKHDLPANVTVHSLGKESGANRLQYLIRFYQLIWQLRPQYDHVFVHMNQIYVILGAALWRAAGKRIGLWYAHGAVTPSLQIAVAGADLVFTSTKQGMRIDTQKRVIVGQGIDTAVFTPAPKKPDQCLRLITVGRVTQSKNLNTLLQACAILKSKHIPFSFQIIGPADTPTEQAYLAQMQTLVQTLDLAAGVAWVGPVTQAQLPAYLQSADVFIHDGSTNSLDKTLIEASLTGCTVISSNPSYAGLATPYGTDLLFTPHNPAQLAAIIQTAVNQTPASAQQMQLYFRVNSSITNLISGIVSRY
jgi:glycosyltransferase involved in cell wall biosynthesis